MKRLALALVLVPSLAIGAGWDETVTSPQSGDTVMINDVSQPTGSKTQYTSLQRLPVSTPTQTELDGKVGTSGNETIDGVKTFSQSPVVPDPVNDNQAANRKFVLENGGSGGGNVVDGNAVGDIPQWDGTEYLPEPALDLAEGREISITLVGNVATIDVDDTVPTAPALLQFFRSADCSSVGGVNGDICFQTP